MASLTTHDIDHLAKLSAASLQTFAEGFALMFGQSLKFTPGNVGKMTIAKLNETCGALKAINTVHCSGPVEGRFDVILDKDALFTLSGVAVMFPPGRINESRSNADVEEAKQAGDAIGEVGNLLVGDMNIIFGSGDDAGLRGLGEREHLLLQLPVQIGEMGIDFGPDVSCCNVMTFTMVLGNFEPCNLYIAVPAAD